MTAPVAIRAIPSRPKGPENFMRFRGPEPLRLPLMLYRSFMSMRRGAPCSRGGLLFAMLGLALLATGCVRQPTAGGPFPALAEFEGAEVTDVSFSGEILFRRDSLAAVIQTRASRCRFLIFPICIPFINIGRDPFHLDLDELARDVSRIQLYHRDHGYYGTAVVPEVTTVEEDEVAVDFRIDPGRQVTLRALDVIGVDSILPTETLLSELPLQVDEPFGRTAFFASADTIRSELLQRGYAYAQVLRNFELDTIARVAVAQYEAVPGPIVFIDTIVFEGNERLSERTLRRHLTFSENQVLLNSELQRSQRNLYTLGMVNFAAVGIAPDTLQVEAQQEQATVLVQVVEAAQFAVAAAAGFGTVECFRTSGQWVNRNFLGGGRTLELRGSLSRIGVGSPTNLGLENSICSALGEEAFLGLEGLDVRDRIDYTVGANFQQPSIFGTQNQLAINLHSERISEPGAFIRESTGGRVAAVRDFEAGPTVVTTTFEVERGRTIASPAILCVGFDTCTQDDLDLLTRVRWSNSLTLAAVQDGTRSDGVQTTGYIVRAGVDWADRVLGSDDNYLRALVEGSAYIPLQPGWSFATNLRFGRFLRGALGPEGSLIPPERRFYAGGPNSVRGFARNALGPTSYVVLLEDEDQDPIASATGGTQLVVASLELRMPSPYASDVTRLAAFVDAGHVAAAGTDLFAGNPIRFTPGVGVRFLTPVGPFRLDVAYNPYPPETGPLYLVDPAAGLILIDPAFRPESRSVWDRFRVQFALGQAF